MFTGPEIIPLPPSVPLQTVTAPLPRVPFASTVPLLTVIVPVCELAPVNVHVPVPSLINAVVPVNAAEFVASVLSPPTRHVAEFCAPSPLPLPALTDDLGAAENSVTEIGRAH